ncbi:MAG: acylneuraminate cytidylyltransferase family protein [Deltaproteobacteria bacterium]|nr:acylneuraminate cytidylyltransferase family protein [Deltaproteobacteria bacterium]
MNSVLGIIPARGGSKRLPHKNILPLAGNPLISYTINAGLYSHYIDELMVSTDDNEIARISVNFGAKVPFIRPPDLAQDDTSTFAVVQHVIDYYKNEEGKLFEYIVLLQPTSPLRDGVDIDNAMSLMQANKADAVISVSQPDHTPLWCNTLPEDLSMEGFLRDDVKFKRSQELDRYYRLNGAIYICKTSRLLEEKTFFLKNRIYAHIMKQEKSIDIDTMLDLMLCEILLSERMSANVS